MVLGAGVLPPLAFEYLPLSRRQSKRDFSWGGCSFGGCWKTEPGGDCVEKGCEKEGSNKPCEEESERGEERGEEEGAKEGGKEGGKEGDGEGGRNEGGRNEGGRERGA